MPASYDDHTPRRRRLLRSRRRPSAVVTRGGTLTAIGEHSLTVDSLTCYFYPTSPSLTGFKVGDHVGVACQSNVLIKIVALSASRSSRTTTAPAAPATTSCRRASGTITALSPTSITVDGLTCSIGAGSPSVAGFKLADKVGIGCSNAALVEDRRAADRDDSGFKVAVQLGPITSIRGDGITVGSLSCKLAATSPSVASFKLGDRVGIGCAGGILFMIGALPTGTAPRRRR